MYRYITFALILLIPAVALAQDTPEDDPWKPLRFLEGTWTGTGEGLSGTSTVTQTYEFVLGGKFMMMTTRAEFPPQKDNSDGEIHEDFAIFSYDSGRKAFIMRGFYVEGYVNTYRLVSVSTDGSLTFNTIDVENAPLGTKARLLFTQVAEDELEQSLWVAFPEKKTSCLAKNRLTKSK